ncbi:MAG: twin-arginine translocase subunit TatC [Anaerolineales bacterium]|nr:twin-arginine translocase subunit TatC [Anaerolineales bacterium]
MKKTLRLLWSILTAPFKFAFWLTSIKDLFAVFRESVEEGSLPEAVNKVIDNPFSIMEHLSALRNNLVRAVLILAAATGLALYYNYYILDFLSKPIEGGIDALVAIDVTEPIGTVMRVALFAGFAVTFPYLAYQIWLFVAPAVISRRRRFFSLVAIPAATLLFAGGVLFAYYILLPRALPFLLNFMGIKTIPRPSSYITFTVGLMFWIGIFFEFPLVMLFSAALGWVKAEMLAQQWRLAIVIITVIAALITPTVDPVNMSLVAGPMIILYFFGVGLAFIGQGGRSLTKKPNS